MQHRLHGYANLPTNAPGWQALVEPAKDAYWKARRDGKDETSALLAAIDVVAGLMTPH